MAQFPPALDYVLNWEDPDRLYVINEDNKGMVISGVNSLAWPAEFEAIAALPVNQRAPAVAAFYQTHFWDPMQVGLLIFQDLASRVLDHGVNRGPEMGVIVLQKSLNLLHPGSVRVDGVLGPLTAQAVNEGDEEALLAAYRTEREADYREVVFSNPTDEPDLAGWLNRARA
jgi:hypothetical protein